MFIDKAVRHVLLRQGVLGLQVKIMQPHDPSGKAGLKHNLPDIVCSHSFLFVCTFISVVLIRFILFIAHADWRFNVILRRVCVLFVHKFHCVLSAHAMIGVWFHVDVD